MRDHTTECTCTSHSSQIRDTPKKNPTYEMLGALIGALSCGLIVCSFAFDNECYDQCLQNRSVPAVSINVAVGDILLFGELLGQWIEGKAMEFNVKYPSITVVPIRASEEKALADAAAGSNTYDAYVMDTDLLIGTLADHFLDMSNFIVDNLNEIRWNTIGRFFRSHVALYQGKVLNLPLTGDFSALLFRSDILAARNIDVPRTLEEFVQASVLLNGTDINNDGVPDFGACMPHIGRYGTSYFWPWVAQFTQYRGTSHGAYFNTDSLEPLFGNPASVEALKLWKQTAGPPELDDERAAEQIALYALQGRCAMSLAPLHYSLVLQDIFSSSLYSVARIPGSERVWWREGRQVVTCNVTFCPHATVYPDGKVVNHAPVSRSQFGGAINGQVSSERQLAAYTFFSWLMHDFLVIEAVIDRQSSGRLDALSIVRPSLLAPSIWYPYGWKDPFISEFCSLAVHNLEHANAVMTLRLPSAAQYFRAAESVLTAYWLGTGYYAGLIDEVGAALASTSLKSMLEAITESGNRQTAIDNYRKLLNIFVDRSSEDVTNRSALPFERWVLCTLSIAGGVMIALIGVLSAGCVIYTYRQQRTLRASLQEKWEETADCVESSIGVLSFPMVLVSLVDLLSCNSVMPYERLRDDGMLIFLDSVGKIQRFRMTSFIIFLSHEGSRCAASDLEMQDFETLRSTVRAAAEVLCTGAELDLTKMYVWLEVSSTPQEHSVTRELAFKSVPLFAFWCDILVVMAPETAETDAVQKHHHFASGLGRAALMAKLVRSGFRNIFLSGSKCGEWVQVAQDSLQELDLHVFGGTFACCTSTHAHTTKCDRELLMPTILGLFAMCLRDSQGVAPTLSACAMDLVFSDKERMFPRHFEFEQRCPGGLMNVELRELFWSAPRDDSGTRQVPEQAHRRSVWHGPLRQQPRSGGGGTTTPSAAGGEGGKAPGKRDQQPAGGPSRHCGICASGRRSTSTARGVGWVFSAILLLVKIQLTNEGHPYSR